MRSLAFILALLLPAIALAQPMPTPIASFDSLDGAASGGTPSDSNLAVGPNHVMVAVNNVFAVYNKSGALTFGPFSQHTLFTNLGASHNCVTQQLVDPIVLYDTRDDRWVLAAIQASVFGTRYLCMTVSQTSDPTGSWFPYAFTISAAVDSPKYAIWQDGYIYADLHDRNVAAFDLPAMVIGGTPRPPVFFTPSWPVGGAGGPRFDSSTFLVPLQFDGYAPAPSQPEIFVGVHHQNDDGSSAFDGIYLYQFVPNWTTPTSSTFTQLTDSPVSVLPFVFPPPFTSAFQLQRFIPTYRVQYRNFRTRSTILVTFPVTAFTGTDATRIIELTKTGVGAWTITQQASYVPDTAPRWNPSSAEDVFGNIAVVYTCGSIPSVCTVGRESTATINTMNRTELILATGVNNTCMGGRWGDYTAVQLDPSDQCTFWMINAYCKTTTWGTRVAAIRMAGCTGAAVANPVDACTSAGCPQQCQAASQGLCPVGWPTITNNGICTTQATCP